MDEDSWYFLDYLNQVQGPYSRGMLEARLQDLEAPAPVTGPGMVTWCSADLVQGFAHLYPQVPDEKDEARAGRFADRYVTSRSLDEMIGLCKGILADGTVVEREAALLEQWCAANSVLVTQWPASVLSRRLRQIFADGRVDEDERADLRDLLQQIVGGPPEASLADRYAIALPLDTPPPTILISGSSFCFTGKFIYGTRKLCMSAVSVRGGYAAKDVTSAVQFLVVGTLATEAWIHGTFGRKIEAAIALRDNGFPIKIVSEEHWTKQLH